MKQSSKESTHTGHGQKTHKHHIVPKHMGGSDEPSNLVECTVEQHAEYHRKLYEEHGCWQDKIAWKALSGLIGKEDIQAEKARESILSRERSHEEWKKGWETRRKNGWKFSEETKKKISEALKGRAKTPFSDEHKKNISDAIKKMHAEGIYTGPPNHAGTKWWNNGTRNKRAAECPGEGYTLGKLKQRNS